MTDKRIIIDGVDIKDCKRRIGKDNFCRYYKRPCAENNYNCIWKKYLRKEQELTDYKKQFKADTKEMEDYQNEIARHLESIKYWQHQAEAKEQECEELERLYKELQDDMLACNKCRATIKLQQQHDQLKKTITEIKEIAENIQSFVDINLEDDVYTEMHKILQKINECEGNDV